jgi:uncharacterized protein
MPANLTAVYREAEAAHKRAVTREEKLATLEEMLRVIPKHKGTEKLQADLRSRISRLRKEPAKKAGQKGSSHRIPTEGAGQIALVGPPNSGKSSLVAHLTKAQPVVADYPMSTREPVPGMMGFGDIAFQLIDLPPVWEGHVESWVYDLIRGADLAWVVVTAEDPLGGFERVDRLLHPRAIHLVPADLSGARGSGARESGWPSEEERRPGWRYLPALLVVTGVDRVTDRADLAILGELLGSDWSILAVSPVGDEGFAVLGQHTFDALDVIRVYTREPGQEADLERPFTLPAGSTVQVLARTIHGELAEQLRFARIWGAAAFDGQRVRSDHVLADGDVVELRT